MSSDSIKAIGSQLRSAVVIFVCSTFVFNIPSCLHITQQVGLVTDLWDAKSKSTNDSGPSATREQLEEMTRRVREANSTAGNEGVSVLEMQRERLSLRGFCCYRSNASRDRSTAILTFFVNE